jgi:hypothetical protein
MFGLLTVGLVFWILGAVVFLAWFFASPGERGLAAVGALFYAFLIGYPAGGLALLAWGIVRVSRRGFSLAALWWALAIYVLPIGVMLTIFRLFLLATPQSAVESDAGGWLGAIAGPVLMALYVVGLAAGFSAPDRPLRSAAMRILAPPLAGTAVIAAWLLWSTLGSAEFQHRGAFELSVERASFDDPGLTIDATLDITKDGAYEYGALYLEVTGGTSGGRVDVMQWLDGDGAPQRVGRHRVRLVWNDLQTDPRASEQRLFFEIRQRREGEQYRPPLREFRIPLSRTP